MPSESPPPRLCASCLRVIVRVTTCCRGHENPLYQESVGRGEGGGGGGHHSGAFLPVGPAPLLPLLDPQRLCL